MGHHGVGLHIKNEPGRICREKGEGNSSEGGRPETLRKGRGRGSAPSRGAAGDPALRTCGACCLERAKGRSLAQGAILRSPTEPEELIQVKPTDQKHQPKKYPRQKNPTKGPQGWRGADGRSKAEHFRVKTAPSAAVKG